MIVLHIDLPRERESCHYWIQSGLQVFVSQNRKSENVCEAKKNQERRGSWHRARSNAVLDSYRSARSRESSSFVVEWSS
ncbi:hypothetical protein CSPAE12_06358 [Colletotrichum incanum]|nr:hypothetical protein CSPAE12_06358 [Colletotrichum incanum]